MASAVPRPCPACQQPLRTGLQHWHLECTRCSHEGSSLLVDIDIHGDREVLDEALREEGLEVLRQRNFRTLASQMKARIPSTPQRRPRLLDVGCAHGWFLEATNAHFDVIGIEPDARVASAAAAKGFPVRKGFFPDVLEVDERFDAIVFNDVMEHIPDIHAAFQACARHLRPGGWVMVNAPARTGALYGLARVLARLGQPASFERLWQKGFPSPHVHYLDDASIRSLGARSDLQLARISTLPSMSVEGLYARIRYDRSVSACKAAALTVALTAAAPLLRVLPADIKVWSLRAA